MSDTFHDELLQLMDEYVHFMYSITQKFPKEELYGVTSQFRRSSISIVLNYVEGYARQSQIKVFHNHVQTSYGSLQESKYLLGFSLKEKYCSQKEYDKGLQMVDRIGAMLWGKL